MGLHPQSSERGKATPFCLSLTLSLIRPLASRLFQCNALPTFYFAACHPEATTKYRVRHPIPPEECSLRVLRATSCQGRGAEESLLCHVPRNIRHLHSCGKMTNRSVFCPIPIQLALVQTHEHCPNLLTSTFINYRCSTTCQRWSMANARRLSI